MNGIDFICAYEKSPHCVTAVALEKTPQGITFWVAANEKLEVKFLNFLRVFCPTFHAYQSQEIKILDGGRVTG